MSLHDPRGTEHHLALVISFRDEEAHLPRLLESLEHQTVPAQQILLIDDGSIDRSGDIADGFAQQNGSVRVLHRERRTGVGDSDRLVDAPELRSFSWGVEQLAPEWETVAKMDGDLILPPTLLEEVRRAFADDPNLGITGAFLSVRGANGRLRREPSPAHHVRGPNKFYRRACYEQIAPLPAFLGWDNIDDLRARRLGWSTRSFTCSSGDIVHLRPTGMHGGRLRAYRRWGRCAWGYGSHPGFVIAGSVRRLAERPYLLCGINYFLGWLNAALRRYPRVEPKTRWFCRQEERERIAGSLRARGRRTTISST